jgi:hypothetical protein
MISHHQTAHRHQSRAEHSQILRMMPPISKDGKGGASERAW